MPLAPGSHLGPFEIVAPIGAGTMGEVYRAHDPRLGRDVALKVLPADYSHDQTRLARFEQEARAAAALSHPNILAVYDVGHEAGSAFIVSELLQGATLRERLAHGPLPLRQAIEVGAQIVNGLAAAHEKHLVHRDLKPENIVITSGGIVKILDFGLAKLAESPAPSQVGSTAPTTPPGTQPGVVLGTLGYMAPEQVRGLPADHRADIFSFGAILYEVLTGRPAFQRVTSADTMAAVLQEPPAEGALVEHGAPPVIIRIVERCLEKLPGARFQSTVDLAFALHGALSADAEVVPRTKPTRWGSRARLAAAVAAIIAAGAVFIRFGPWGQPVLLPELPPVKFSLTPPAGVVQIDGTTMKVSPGGTRLAFTGTTAEGVRRLWVRAFDSFESFAIPDSDGATQPFWAPDGQSLGFFAGGELKRIDLMSGAAITLAEAPQAAGATWSEENVIVFSSRGRLHRIAAAGGTAQRLDGINGEREGATLAYPTFLPGGRRILYLDTGSGGVGEAAVYGAAIDSAERTVVLSGASSNAWYSRGHLFYLEDTWLVARPFDADRLTLAGNPVRIADQIERTSVGAPSGSFSVGEQMLVYRTGAGARGSPTALTWFDRTGTAVGTVGERADYADIELSPDGTRAIVSQLDPGTGRDLWIFDLLREIPTRLTTDPADDYPGVWSNDGTQVVFGSRRKGHFDLYQKSARGGPDRDLLVDTRDKWPMSWTPDGRTVIFTEGTISAVGTVPHTWGVPVAGEPKSFPILADPQFRHFPAKLSPDGRWLVYVSDESGDAEIYVAPYPSLEGKWRVSKDGGGWPRWRPDGKEIVFLAPDNTTLMASAVDGRGAAFVAAEPRVLFKAPFRPGSRFVYDVAMDGRVLGATLSGSPVAASISVVVNWQAEFRR